MAFIALKVSSLVTKLQLSIKGFYENQKVDSIKKIQLYHTGLNVSVMFDEYCMGHKNKKRQKVSININIICWLIVLRFFILALNDEEWLWILFGDAFYVSGYRRPINFIWMLAATICTSFRYQ